MKLRIFIILIVSLALVIGRPSDADAKSIVEATKGKILLQVQEHGEAWYVYPVNLKRYYLGRPVDAFNVMRNLGLGVSEQTYKNWNGVGPSNLAGRIVLRAEAKGEAYYIIPNGLHLVFLGKPGDAWLIMKGYGLGITNTDLDKITKSTTGGADANVNLTEACPADTIRYTNQYYKYTFCYDENGEIKENPNHSIFFSRLKGGENGKYDGTNSVNEGYASIASYATNLKGATSKEHAVSNGQGVYVEMLKQDFDNSTLYHVMAQNQINKQIIELSYESADGTDQMFMDGIWNTFEFMEKEANTANPWKSAVIMGVCPTNPKLKYFKQYYQYTERYEFCYNSDWVITLDTGNKIKIVPAIQNGQQAQGELMLLLEYNQIKSVYNTRKNLPESSGLITSATAKGNSALDYTFTKWVYAGGDGVKSAPDKSVSHYIEIFDQDEDYYGRRAVFQFRGDVEEYDFSDFFNNLNATFRFFDIEK